MGFFRFVRLPEALNALKSSLIFTPPPMIFHVFTEDHLRREFQERVMDRSTQRRISFDRSFSRSTPNGQWSINRSSRWNFIRSSIHVATTNVGERFSSRVARNVCFFRSVGETNEEDRSGRFFISGDSQRDRFSALCGHWCAVFEQCQTFVASVPEIQFHAIGCLVAGTRRTIDGMVQSICSSSLLWLDGSVRVCWEQSKKMQFLPRIEFWCDADEFDSDAWSEDDLGNHGDLRRVPFEYHLGWSMLTEYLFQLSSRFDVLRISFFLQPRTRLRSRPHLRIRLWLELSTWSLYLREQLSCGCKRWN